MKPQDAKKYALAQKLTHSVGRHPDREQIEDLILEGWPMTKIARWLANRYPLEDRNGRPIPRHRAMQLSPYVLREYRRRFFPRLMPERDETALEAVLPPRVDASPVHWELAMQEQAIRATEVHLARSIERDEKLGIASESTLRAAKQLAELSGKRAVLQARLGVDGYELVPERQEIKMDQRTLQVNARAEPMQVENLELAKRLLALDPGERQKALEAGKVEDAEIVQDDDPDEPL